MNLKVRINKSIESINQKNKFIWSWGIKPYYVGVLYFFVLGSIFLFYGITSDFSFKATYVQGGSTTYNLHLGITIGSALVIVALISFVIIQNDRKNFFRNADRHIKQVGQNETFIIFNDTDTIYFDSIMRQEFKWEKFSGFVYKKGFLLLLTGKKIPTSFIVHESELTQDEFKSLLNFIRTKLRQVD